MKKLLILFLFVLSLVSVKAQVGVSNQVFYEPFNQYTLGGGTISTFFTDPAIPPNYTEAWVISQTAKNNSQLRDARLYPMIPPAGLSASSTNALYFQAFSGTLFQLPINPIISSNSAYFSMVLLLSGYGNVGAQNATDFIAGFGEGPLAGTTGFEYRLATKILPNNNLVLGLAKGDGPITYETTERPNNSPSVFIVGRYSINSTNGTCDLWINPDPAFFSADESNLPAPTIAGVGADVANLINGNVEWFYLRGSNFPASRTVDEVRVGTTWASVTPKSAPIWGIVPVNNPGFAATNTSEYVYDATTQFVGDLMPDRSYTHNFGSSILGDAATGATISGATVNAFDWTSSPSAGVLRYAAEFNVGQGPTNSAGYISMGDNLFRGIFQTLASVPVVIPYNANTRYTLTAQVSARLASNVTFPSTIQVALAGNSGDLPGTLTFTPPARGDTSLATFVADTGAVPPSNALTIVFRAQGYTGEAASQAFFDNVTLTAVALPQITGIQVVGGNVQITFVSGDTNDLATSFTLLSSTDVAGVSPSYTDTGATVTGGNGAFQVTTPVSGAARFYQIKK